MTGFDPYQPVVPGTARQAPSARTFNGLLKAGQAYSRSKFGTLETGQGGNPVDPSLTCIIQNKTGADLGAFAVLVQGAAIVDPATKPYEVQALPAFEGHAVSVVTAPFVVTQQPLKANAMGQAVVSGLALVDVNITSLAHTRAVPTAGVTNQLASAASGGVMLWWTPGLTGVQKCLVMVGSQSDGPDATKTIRGWVSTTTQSFAGVKTFYSGIQIGDGTSGSGTTLQFSPSGAVAGGYIQSSGTGVIIINTQGGIGQLLFLGNSFSINQGSGNLTGQDADVATGGGQTLHFRGGILTSVT